MRPSNSGRSFPDLAGSGAKKVEFPENEALVLEPMVVYISIYTSEHTGGYQNDFTNIF